MRIGDELKRELGCGDAAFDRTVRQTLDGLETEAGPVKKKMSFGLLMALVIVMVLGATALAAANSWSVLLERLPGVQCTPEAESLVQPGQDVIWENDDVRMVVRETLYDGFFLYVAADLYPNADDVVVLDWFSGREDLVRPEAPATLLDAEAEVGMTVEDYCEAHGLRMVDACPGFYLPAPKDEFGEWIMTYCFTSHRTDGSLAMVLTAAYTGDPERIALWCHSTRVPKADTDYRYDTVPLHMTRVDAHALEERSSTQVFPMDDKTDMRLDGVRAVRTPIGSYVELTWSTDADTEPYLESHPCEDGGWTTWQYSIELVGLNGRKPVFPGREEDGYRSDEVSPESGRRVYRNVWRVEGGEQLPETVRIQVDRNRWRGEHIGTDYLGTVNFDLE